MKIFGDINVDPASEALRVEIDATRQALRFLLYSRALASRTAGNKRAGSHTSHIFPAIHARTYAHTRTCELVSERSETARIDGKFKCDRSQGREGERGHAVSGEARICTHARTRV